MGKKNRRRWRSSAPIFVEGAAKNGVEQDKADDDLRPDGEVRRLRLQQVARRRLRAGRLPDRLAEGALSGRVLRRDDDARHGQHRQARAAIRRELERLGIALLPPDVNTLDGRVRRRDDGRGQEGDPLRPGRDQGRRPRRHGRGWPRSARTTARSRTCSTSPSGSTSGC